MLSGAVDVHSHFLPPAYRDFLERAGYETVDGGAPVPAWSPETAIDVMDRLGVAHSVLSICSPFLGHGAGTAEAGLAQSLNDYAANLHVRHGDRFSGFAILPMHDVDATVAEASRALDELKLAGVVLPTNVDGRYLGHPDFIPLLELLSGRGAVAFIHPTSPCCLDVIGLGLPGPMIKFPFDTVRTLTSLIFSQSLQRVSGIQFIVPYLGGPLPVLAHRIAAIGSAKYMGDRARAAEDTLAFLGRLWFDTAGLARKTQFSALRDFAHVSRILFGTDFPFAPLPRIQLLGDVFSSLDLTGAERYAVERGNAATLFSHPSS